MRRIVAPIGEPMRCSKCGSENPDDKRFCGDCGVPLAHCCPKCGVNNPPGKRFCGDCGSALSANDATHLSASSWNASGIRIAADQTGGSSIAEGERKTVTALFADIKGSMELIEELDPEEARAIVDPALKLMIDSVHRYDGYIVQSTGDGIFALFGAPIANEDHPQRALYAALRMQEDLKRYSDRNRAEGRLPVQVRVGVHTGEVVVRSLRTDATHVEYTPIGHSVSLAARMQVLAPIGSIATTDQLRNLCEGYFVFNPLGPTKVKGVGEPVNIFEVTGIGALRTHFQASLRRGLTKFVGRQHEIEQMKRALDLAKTGHGGVVAAAGDPGVGKSRLLHEFKAVAGFDCKVLEAFAASYGKDSSYLPIIELLKGYLEIGASDDDRKRQEKVTGKILTLDLRLADTLPYLFTLLSLNPGEDPLAQMDPQIKRRRTQDALKRVLLRESLNQPGIVIIEDLHWIDDETQGVLNVLVDSLGNARLLLLVNYRPEYSHQWGRRTYYTQLRLDPLGRESAEEMLNAILGDMRANRDRLATQSERDMAQLRRLVIERTEGNPFFMEEIIQALIEQSALQLNGVAKLTRPLTQIRVPATVQAVLASRIDQLPANEKDLLHTLAVLGREFPLALVQRVAPTPGDELEQILSRLRVGEFIYEQPASGDIEYIFKHALTQEVAYNSILLERRKWIHERTAQAIEEMYQSQLDDHYSALAYHYAQSVNIQKAVQYLRLAGQQALQRSANTSAITHLGNGLQMLRTLPDTTERAQQELPLQIAMGSVLVATQGYTTPAVKSVYTRARELCQQVRDTPQLFSVLNGLRRFYYLRTEFTTARELAEQLLVLAQTANDPALFVLARQALGVVAYSLAELIPAREHLEQAPTFYNRQQHRFHTLSYGEDPCVISMSFEIWVLWLLGYPDQALGKSRQALALAQELSHPLSLALALNFAAWLHQLRGEEQAAQERIANAITLSSDQGLPNWLAQSTIMRGWQLAEQGQVEVGITEIRRGLDNYRSTGAMLTVTYFLALLAEAYGKMRRAREGLTVLADALAMVSSSGERFYEAELHRLQGKLTLQLNCQCSSDRGAQSTIPHAEAVAQADTCFRRAIEVASGQEAKSLELRAVMSLCRLHRQPGQKTEALHMLADIYNWFTEGFDTADLKEAKALLDQLRTEGG
jgi:class 3 adenylate cyclase/predicted ATPase